MTRWERAFNVAGNWMIAGMAGLGVYAGTAEIAGITAAGVLAGIAASALLLWLFGRIDKLAGSVLCVTREEDE